MKVLSLFSGVGGFDLGLENAGMETVFQCEWDKHATSILERHWPDVPRWGDITTLTGRHILDHAPVIDVVAWGSPCQDLSVAGKRAGLSGQRSGLFHEGIRIIKELRKETDNAYPRISIWENVYGALNSNKGADFGLVLDEMAEAGAMVIEWRVLDAQYFGVPQRRRRVFVIAVFDPRIAANCPDPLLPLRQGVRWNPATSRTTRQTVARPAEESLGGGGEVAGSLTWRMKNGYNGQDAYSNLLQVVEENHARPIGQPVLGSDIVGPLAASDWKFPQQQQVNENKVVIEPFVKAKRAQSTSDDETWVEGDINPTINQFDAGDVRATTVVVGSLQARDYKGTNHEGARDGKLVVESSPSHPIANTLRVGSGVGERGDGTDNLVTAIVMRQREGKPGGGKGPLLSENKSLTLAAAGNDQTLFVEQPIVFENSYRDSARIAEDGVTQTLSAKMGTGGGNTPMVAFATNQRAEVRELGDKAVALSAEPGTNQQTYIAIPIQDGREIDKNQNGLGIAESGAPAYTLDQTGAQAVAYSFDSLASNSMKSSNPNSGVRETEIAKTLDTARPDPSCNQGGIAIVEPIGIQGNVIGRQDHNGPAGKGHTDEGDPMFTLNTTDRHAVIQYDGYNQRIYEDDVSVTIRIGRDSSDCIAQPTAAFKPGASAEAHGIGYEEEIAPSLEAGGGGNNKPAVLEPTMSVRRLTPLECERLMGWPDNWTAGQADTHRYKQCGNGVASPVAQWIGEQILNIPQ